MHMLDSEYDDSFTRVLQHWINDNELCQIRMKLSEGGCGLRSTRVSNVAGYLSSLCAAITHLNKHFNAQQLQHSSAAHTFQATTDTLQKEYQLPLSALVYECGVNATGLLPGNDGNDGDAVRDPSQRLQCLWQLGHDDIPKHMQRRVTTAIEKREKRSLLSRLAHNDDMRIRLLSASVKGANVWQTALPTEPALVMPGDNVAYAMKHLLGREVHSQLLNGTLRCACDKAFEEGDQRAAHGHFLRCQRYTGSTVTARHDKLKAVIARLAKEHLGAYVCLEPNGFKQPNMQLQCEDDNSEVDDDAVAPHHRRHADILIMDSHGQDEYVDVSVTEPTACSNRAKADVYRVARVSMKAVSERKHNKYGAMCRAHALHMCAAVFESYGAPSAESMQLLKRIARGSLLTAPSTALFTALLQCSVAIQNGNAVISRNGWTECRLQALGSLPAEHAALEGMAAA
jgi:hypothetical protein